MNKVHRIRTLDELRAAIAAIPSDVPGETLVVVRSHGSEPSGCGNLFVASKLDPRDNLVSDEYAASEKRSVWDGVFTEVSPVVLITT